MAQTLNQVLTPHLKIICFLFSLWGLSGIAFSQPVWESRITREDIILFEDFHNPKLKYYSPGRLKLKTKANGEPDFMLTQLRYTGVSLSGDQGNKRFTNIIQMNIEMENTDPLILEKLRTQFRLSSRVKLSPLPIRNLESSLISSASGAETDQEVKKLNGYFQGNSETNGIYWTERSFTLALDNNESQLIEDQLKNNRLAFSFSYSFYADVMLKSYKEIMTSGNPEFKKKFQASNADLGDPDTALAQMVVRANSFSISVDLAQFPNCIRKIDINQNNTPPAYAYVEVRCHDFSNKIRTDLFFKTFELEAQGVSGDPVIGEVKFSANRPEIHTMTVAFPYAVKMNKPPRYRITETTDSGERITLPWTYLNTWKPMIDITTSLEQLRMGEKSLDIELDSGWVGKHQPQRVEVWARYYFLQKPRVQVLTFNKDEMNMLKNMTLQVDLNSTIQYRIEIVTTPLSPPDSWHTLAEDYLLIK